MCVWCKQGANIIKYRKVFERIDHVQYLYIRETEKERERESALEKERERERRSRGSVQ